MMHLLCSFEFQFWNNFFLLYNVYVFYLIWKETNSASLNRWKSITFKDNWFVYTCILKLFDTVLAKISDQVALIISVVLCCYPMETTLYIAPCNVF